jgi:hypothetical protein
LENRYGLRLINCPKEIGYFTKQASGSTKGFSLFFPTPFIIFLEETIEEKSADDSNDPLPIATGEDTSGENTISDVMIENMVNLLNNKELI